MSRPTVILAGVLLPVAMTMSTGCTTVRWMRQARQAEQAGQHYEAYELYCAVLEKRPSNWAAANGLARVSFQAAQEWANHGRAAAERGDYQRAWQSYMQALTIQPALQSLAGRIRALERDHPDAVAEARRQYLEQGAAALASAGPPETRGTAAGASAQPPGQQVATAGEARPPAVEPPARPQNPASNEILDGGRRPRAPAVVDTTAKPAQPDAGHGAARPASEPDAADSPSRMDKAARQRGNKPEPDTPDTLSRMDGGPPAGRPGTTPDASASASRADAGPQPARPAAKSDASNWPSQTDNELQATRGVSNYLFTGIVSRGDKRFPKELKAIDGLSVKVRDTDRSPDADLDVCLGDQRVARQKDCRVGQAFPVRGHSGREYEVVVLTIVDATETVRFGIRPSTATSESKSAGGE